MAKTTTPGAGIVQRDDPRYPALLRKRFNRRFAGRPDRFHLVRSAAEVGAALEAAVREGARVAVQSGGHCLEGFVSDPEVRVVIDTGLMSSVYFDESLGAVAIEAGATLGEAQRELFLGWGTLLPAGQSPDLGIGGHVLGGGFGFLHREHGLAVDHLYGVEVVVVDERGQARAVIATREEADPHRELWWAHTGCGGGNLGVVTRYFFRSPGAGGWDPALCLPRAPEQVTTFRAEWRWDELDASAFCRLIGNYGEWCEQNGAPDSPSAKLFSVLVAGRPPAGSIVLRGLTTAGLEAAAQIDAHLAALERGVVPPRGREVKAMSWLEFALDPFPDLFATGPLGVSASRASLKIKDAFFRKRHSDRQLEIAYEYLVRRSPELAGGSFGLAAYGGRLNGVPCDATAAAQRSSVMTTSCGIGWGEPAQEAPCLEWVRHFYRDLFAETGGVPIPNDQTDGAMINHPDSDLASPEWNTSGVPWSALYYQGNYSRIQQVKAAWDPGNVFRHALSIRARSRYSAR